MRRLVPLVTALLLLALPSRVGGQGSDPQAVVQAYLAAVNAHQLAAVMAFYADDLVGKDAIRAAFREDFANSTFRMDAVAFRVSGDRVTWDWQVNFEPVRGVTLPPLTGTTTVVVDDGRFRSIQGGLDQAPARRRQAALQALLAARVPPRSAQQASPDTQGRGAAPPAGWLVALPLCLLGLLAGVAAQRAGSLPVWRTARARRSDPPDG